jgi:hypothetical protein
MQNTLIALNLLSALLQQAISIGSTIASAQQSGTDITPDQLATLSGDYQAALTQLETDIAAAAAKGD